MASVYLFFVTRSNAGQILSTYNTVVAMECVDQNSMLRVRVRVTAVIGSKLSRHDLSLQNLRE